MKAILPLLALFLVLSSFSPGNYVYTKRSETVLKDQPSLGGKNVGQLKWGTKVKITEVQGRWAKIDGSGKEGWVFSGNLAEKKPPAENENDFLPTSASETTASIAARPLNETSRQYGQRRNLGSAVADLLWLEKTADAISHAQVQGFMQTHHLGEYAQ